MMFCKFSLLTEEPTAIFPFTSKQCLLSATLMHVLVYYFCLAHK